MEMAVIEAWFMVGYIWYIQKEEVAIMAEMAVIKANHWPKQFEDIIFATL